jgi:hypothetical protein
MGVDFPYIQLPPLTLCGIILMTFHYRYHRCPGLHHYHYHPWPVWYSYALAIKATSVLEPPLTNTHACLVHFGAVHCNLQSDVELE